MYYVYKYIKENNIVYIGKTKNLHRRIKEHLKEKDLVDCSIFYTECSNSVEMDLLERALIDFYKPTFNKQFNNSAVSTLITIKEPIWILYKEKPVMRSDYVRGRACDCSKIRLSGKKERLSQLQLTKLRGIVWLIMNQFKLTCVDRDTLFKLFFGVYEGNIFEKSEEKEIFDIMWNDIQVNPDCFLDMKNNEVIRKELKYG